MSVVLFFFFSSRRRHTRYIGDWSSDVCSSDLERILNLIIVTPRMHGIHHSIIERETNSNWGTIFCWWDKLHGTLRRDVPRSEERRVGKVCRCWWSWAWLKQKIRDLLWLCYGTV